MSDVFAPELLTQTATYWAPAGRTGYGGRTYSAPVKIACFWEDSVELVIDKKGQQTKTRAIVIVDRDLDPDGYLAQGDQTATADPTSLAGTWEIKRFDKTAGLSAPLAGASEVCCRVAYL